MKNSYAPRWLLFSKKFTVCSPKNSGQWPSFFLFIKSLKICIKNGGDIALNSKTPAKTYKDRFCCYSHFELTFQRDNNDEESDFFLNINSLQYFCPFFQAWVSSSLVKKMHLSRSRLPEERTRRIGNKRCNFKAASAYPLGKIYGSVLLHAYYAYNTSA